MDERRLAAWRAYLRSHAALVDRLDRELQDEVGLPLTWYDVLAQLHRAPGHRLRLGELADSVVLSRSGLTRLLDRMVTAGLVERQRCATDRRGAFAALTPAGADRLQAAAPTHLRGVGRHFADHLTAGEADAICSGLEKVLAAATDDRTPRP